MIIKILDIVESLVVIPKVSPTVPIAEAVSNKVSVRAKPSILQMMKPNSKN